VATKELNLGILAHVDAGKTTLTERLLYDAGAIDRLGSVDAGTTQTDSLALERQRGITIRSAVASFGLGEVHVNLIDTPGHPDFIAEVERVLNVLDGAVLVISGVEGVQPQTRILMRALQRLRIPTLLFVNKLDRPGADAERVLHDISERLTTAAVPGGPHGARLAELLAERDDRIMAAFVDDEAHVPPHLLQASLAAQTAQALVHPVFFGSAATGDGLDSLRAGITDLLPTAAGEPADPVSGAVFKIERAANGEKVAYVRMFSGTIHVRERLHFGRGLDGKVTAIAVFERGPAVQRPAISAGGVAKLWGLAAIQIGDRIGEVATAGPEHHFAPPTLESVVAAERPDDRAQLRVALAQLAEQDPLIDVRQDDGRQELSVSLYGEVQKEIIQATLANDFGLEVTFCETTPIYIERPIRAGEAVELLHADTNPYLATVGLRIDPAPEGFGIEFRLQVDPRTTPLYVYKTLDGFAERMDQYIREALHEGLFGWDVSDCVVTMTKCTYSVPDGPPSRRGPLSTAADFRKLTPLVVRQALERAGTVVCEPMARVRVELPADAIGAMTAALARLGAAVETPSLRRQLATIDAELSATQAHELQRRLPGLTRGEGVLDSSFAGYRPVSGEQPARHRREAESHV
jgi:ribosomal protection tetracycline resistance protein